MTNQVQCLSSIARLAAVLATVVAMLLPLPARCASCLATAENCPRCAAADAIKGAALHAPKACCHHRAAIDEPSVVVGAANSVEQGAHACGCVVRSVPRTAPTVEKLASHAELLATLAVPADLAADLTINKAAASIQTLADSPPSIPHRILHCSWII